MSNSTISPRIELHSKSPCEALCTLEHAQDIYKLPFSDLLFRAQEIHRANFDPNAIQMSRLLSIKTGGCPEDCGYCSQSSHYPSGLKASKLLENQVVRSSELEAPFDAAALSDLVWFKCHTVVITCLRIFFGMIHYDITASPEFANCHFSDG